MSSLLSPTLGSLWRISLPLMLTTLSANLMFLLDRLILARYSAESMNAAAVAAMSCAVLQFGGVAIASIAEVFVGQYNGAKQHNKTAEPVWQMIWFSLFLFVLFVPIAIWGGPYSIPLSLQKEGLPYFGWVAMFSPLMAMIAALSAFFIGRGFVKLVTLATLVSNLANAGLNIVLVFGIEGWLQPLGTEGAAIATVLSQGFQVVILAFVFLNKHHRTHFQTHRFHFKKAPFLECLKVGTPSSISHMIEMAAWATLFRIAASVNLDYVTVQTVGNSVFVLFAFVTEGMQKGVIAIASNLIGAKKDGLFSKLLFSAVKLHCFFIIAFAFPLIFYPDLVVSQFLPSLQDPNSHLYQECVTVLKWVWAYFILDGIIWSLSGVLTAGGDTRFIMLMNATAAWFLAILPIYIAVHYFNAHSSTAWGISLIYGAANMISFFLRYRSNRWKKLVVSG